jgi:hypothetical protein
MKHCEHGPSTLPMKNRLFWKLLCKGRNALAYSDPKSFFLFVSGWQLKSLLEVRGTSIPRILLKAIDCQRKFSVWLVPTGVKHAPLVGSICLLMCLSICSPIYSPARLSVHLSAYPSVHLHGNRLKQLIANGNSQYGWCRRASSMHPSLDLSACSCVCPSVCQSIHLLVCLSIFRPIHLFICMSIHIYV